MVDKLLGCGQDHLFEHWPAPGEGDDDKRRFLGLVNTEGLRVALAWRESRFSS